MKKNLNNGFQGDVEFKEILKLPKGVVKTIDHILAKGSTGGNVHIITGDIELFKDNQYTYGVIKTKARLQHTFAGKFSKTTLKSITKLPQADHNDILLPKGVYLFGIHKRYNPYDKVFEEVKD